MPARILFHRIALVCALLCIAAVAAPAGSARAATLDTIHTFCGKRGCADGLGPQAGLVMDTAGNFYGIADGCCGADNTVFELTPLPGGKWRYSVLFSCNICLTSRGRLIVDTAGNLYTTQFELNQAVEFPVQPGQKKRPLVVLYTFGHSAGDGSSPIAGLTYAGAASGLPYDGVSPLYGTTFQGGSMNQGTVYQLTPGGGGTWTEQVIHSFCGGGCNDGAEPFALPLIDSSGNLYGTTRDGGSNAAGTIYELSNGGGVWNLTVLHDNCQLRHCRDGATVSDLAFDGSGNIVGVGEYGGSHREAGVIFRLVPAGTSSTYNVLYDFCSVPRNCRDGAAPIGPLIVDAFGNLFGVTAQGGGHDIDPEHWGGGTVFELSGSTLTTLHAFCGERDCRDGAYPPDGIVMDTGGNLFGVTSMGGRLGEGTVFEITP